MSTTSSFGKKIKIAKIFAQRDILEKKLNECILQIEDSTATVRVIGHIFDENIEWLKKIHNISVYTSRIADVTDEDFGFELNLLTPDDNIKLSPIEIDEASSFLKDVYLPYINDTIGNSNLNQTHSFENPCDDCNKPGCEGCNCSNCPENNPSASKKTSTYYEDSGMFTYGEEEADAPLKPPYSI